SHYPYFLCPRLSSGLCGLRPINARFLKQFKTKLSRLFHSTGLRLIGATVCRLRPPLMIKSNQ
ncbi:hypothetical protein KKA02_03555, partial [Patescibacteria group bacterium]|nr:hypothetical protein [Patescibacteria group bacterium]